MVDIKKKLKMALVVGASHALSFKRDNSNASDEEAIQHITRESNNILEKLDNEE